MKNSKGEPVSHWQTWVSLIRNEYGGRLCALVCVCVFLCAMHMRVFVQKGAVVYPRGALCLPLCAPVFTFYRL